MSATLTVTASRPFSTSILAHKVGAVVGMGSVANYRLNRKGERDIENMGTIKIYRYRILPDRVAQFLDIQKRADAIYREHVDYQIAHYRSRSDPWQWTEVHTYSSAESLAIASNLHERSPPLKELFLEFLSTLDPSDSGVSEEVFEDQSIRSPDGSAKSAGDTRAASI